MKIYCEPGALSADLRRFQRDGRIELVNFPYDENALTKQISASATVSDAQWRDLNVKSWGDLGVCAPTWDSFKGSDRLPDIRKIIGPHRRDALHVDSAYKTGCLAFVTADSDILDHRDELEALLGMRFFHPEREAGALRTFIEGLADRSASP